MKLTWEPLTLELRTTFRIAHGADDRRYNVLARLDDGLGEAAAVTYHGETQAGIMDYLSRVADDIGKCDDPFLIEDVLNRLPPGSQAARAAIDIALHDLWGKRLGQPLYRLFGLDPTRLPLTSFTIAMDEPALMAQRAEESALPIIKVKVGGENDEAMVAAIRNATNAKLRVDANAGWTREQAAAMTPRLAQYDLEFIEQPLPVGDIEGLRWLRAQKFGLPIFADEPVKTARDVAAHAGAVDGVVVKLMKTGGMREALRAIHTARALDMQVMLSCMVEGSVGVTAAAHLAPLCDYADLDGPLLIRNDRFKGVRYDGARMILPNGAGLGVTEVERMANQLVITVNGKQHLVAASPDTPLLYVLRNELGLNSPQFGCGSENCGACTVLLGAQAIKSCKVTVSEATTGTITTLEGLGTAEEPHPIQRAFIEEQAAQCGYCGNGMIIATAALLWKNPHPTDEQIYEALDGNLCRCGAHLRIIRAVKRAAELLAAKGA